ncbi:MAG: hypothetical protein E2O39_05685 [Planctomycetota bacterium]|nr:MAG: hypothetical protein E2O39_05685 [Planctomycetota bacterium]
MATPLLGPRLLALALVGLVPPALCAGGTEDTDAEKARAQLEKAELRYEQGRYNEATTYYRRLAKKYPDTAPGRIAAARSLPSCYLGSTLIVDNGPSANRVDVALMGDGYTLEHQKAFDKLADDVPPLFERQATFREYFPYFNFRRFNLVSKDAMVDGFGREEDTALNGHTRKTIQGHVAVDARLVRKMLALAPAHDGVAIVYVRAGILGTGGSGFATIGGTSSKITIHEWGHAFARLADEYSKKTHDRGGVRNRVNVSGTDDPTKAAWAHWIAAKVPGIGMYQGASGQVRGAWKPTSGGCVMDSGEFFCKPCQEAIVLRIYSFVDPIDEALPRPHARRDPASLTVTKSIDFRITVMTPEKHRLQVAWWVLPERSAPPEPRTARREYANGLTDRRGRGPLPHIKYEPVKTSKGKRDGVHKLTVKANSLEPGRYRVVCRAWDTTKMKGDKFPWVLRDEYGVLESERAWWIVVPAKGE